MVQTMTYHSGENSFFKLQHLPKAQKCGMNRNFQTITTIYVFASPIRFSENVSIYKSQRDKNSPQKSILENIIYQFYRGDASFAKPNSLPEIPQKPFQCSALHTSADMQICQGLAKSYKHMGSILSFKVDLQICLPLQ